MHVVPQEGRLNGIVQMWQGLFRPDLDFAPRCGVNMLKGNFQS